MNVNSRTEDRGAEKDPGRFPTLAARFISHYEQKGVAFRSHRDRMLRYVGTHYVLESQMAIWLRKFFLGHNIHQNNHIVSNVRNIIEAMTHCDAGDQLPFWYGRKEEVPPQNVIAFRNGLFDVATVFSRAGRLGAAHARLG
jgi:hypothetical protein